MKNLKLFKTVRSLYKEDIVMLVITVVMGIKHKEKYAM